MSTAHHPRPKLAEEHHNFVPTPDKTCPVCGKTFNRRRDKSGRLEDRAVYARRDCCSMACGYRWRSIKRQRGREERYEDHLVGACEACGAEAPLQVHPVDGDTSNGTPEDVQMLCWRCFSFWHTVLKRTGRKAGRMPPLFDAARDTLSHRRYPKEGSDGRRAG